MSNVMETGVWARRWLWLAVGAIVLAASALQGTAAPAMAAPVGQQVGEGCTVVGDKVASPTEVMLGETVQVRLTLRTECPPSTFRSGDIVLAIDRSLSMLSDGKLRAAKEAAVTFVDATDLSAHRVGVVGFHEQAQEIIGLSNDREAIVRAVEGIGPNQGTDMAAALETAADLLGQDRRADALPVVILITDGSPNAPSPDPAQAALRAANAAKLSGVQIYTIGLGSNAAEDLLRLVASSADDYYYAPDVLQLDEIYRRIALLVGTFVVRDLRVVDTLTSDVTLIDGSAVPNPADVSGDVLTWEPGLLPSDGLEWIYEVRPTRSGTFPTNVSAVATYRNVEGQTRSFTFPVPEITVVDEPDEVQCDVTSDWWTLTIHSFPDEVGQSGSSYSGCNNRFDSADWWQGARYPLPELEYEVHSGDGARVLYRGRGVPGAGRVDQWLYIRLCEPPPYRVRLLTEDLAGYELCTNSPRERTVELRDFRPRSFQRTHVRFGFVRP